MVIVLLKNKKIIPRIRSTRNEEIANAGNLLTSKKRLEEAINKYRMFVNTLLCLECPLIMDFSYKLNNFFLKIFKIKF